MHVSRAIFLAAPIVVLTTLLTVTAADAKEEFVVVKNSAEFFSKKGAKTPVVHHPAAVGYDTMRLLKTSKNWLHVRRDGAHGLNCANDFELSNASNVRMNFELSFWVKREALASITTRATEVDVKGDSLKIAAGVVVEGSEVVLHHGWKYASKWRVPANVPKKNLGWKFSRKKFKVSKLSIHANRRMSESGFSFGGEQFHAKLFSVVDEKRTAEKKIRATIEVRCAYLTGDFQKFDDGVSKKGRNGFGTIGRGVEGTRWKAMPGTKLYWSDASVAGRVKSNLLVFYTSETVANASKTESICSVFQHTEPTINKPKKSYGPVKLCFKTSDVQPMD